MNSAIDSSVTRKAFGVGLALSHSNSTNLVQIRKRIRLLRKRVVAELSHYPKTKRMDSNRHAVTADQSGADADLALALLDVRDVASVHIQAHSQTSSPQQLRCPFMGSSFATAEDASALRFSLSRSPKEATLDCSYGVPLNLFYRLHSRTNGISRARLAAAVNILHR